MYILVELLEVIVLAAIAVILSALLVAIKSGFSEIIKGLEAIYEQLGKR